MKNSRGFPSKNAGPQTQPAISHLNIGGKKCQKGKDCLNQALPFFMGDETPMFHHHDFPQVLRCFSHPKVVFPRLFSNRIEELHFKQQTFEGFMTSKPHFFSFEIWCTEDFGKGPGALEKAVSDICYEVPWPHLGFRKVVLRPKMDGWMFLFF